MPDLSTFYYINTPEHKLEQLRDILLHNDHVEAAYIRQPGMEPFWTVGSPEPADPPSSTPNFLGRQLYFNPAPGGFDANYAKILPGGMGKYVRIIDCERGWRLTHEDLLANDGGLITGTIRTESEDHGTAVAGIVGGDNNLFGVTGFAPDAMFFAASRFNSTLATAIKTAADKLNVGDLILLETQDLGPNANTTSDTTQFGYVASEWLPDTFAAVQYAVAKGIVVVAAAGNGGQDLDDPVYNTAPTGYPPGWKNPFNPQNPPSGAILVGAGMPPPGTHGRGTATDRSKASYSNWGSRLDVQGWGQEVTSAGYGDLQGGQNKDLWYTDVFGGTSSSSATIAGVMTVLQSILKARGRRPLTSPEARVLLRSLGSPQQDDPAVPAGARIGKRPNLRTLIPLAANWQCRSADFNGDGIAEILVSSSKGIAILKRDAGGFSGVAIHNNGDRLGGQWLLNTTDNILGPVANYDASDRVQSFIVSPWGVGILKLQGNVMTPIMMQPNGTRFGGWLLNTADNCFGPAADFDGDGSAEILVSSPWGIGILKRQGNTMVPLVMYPNGTVLDGWRLNTVDNDFTISGTFQGGRKANIFVSSPWGIGIMSYNSGGSLSCLAMIPNGTRIGGWLLNTSDNRFGPVGDFDGDGQSELLLSSPWGIGVLKFDNGRFTNPMLQPNGTRFGGWLLNTADNQFVTSRDFDGDHKDEILVVSPWGIGILKLQGTTMAAPMMEPNGTRFQPGGWLLNTANDWPGSGARFTRTDMDSVLIQSPWGIGLLEMSGNTMSAQSMKANGSTIGSWTLNTDESDFGHGI